MGSRLLPLVSPLFSMALTGMVFLVISSFIKKFLSSKIRTVRHRRNFGKIRFKKKGSPRFPARSYRTKFPSKPPIANYSLRSAILTPAEASFFQVLETLFDHETRIFSKVRLADLFDVGKETMPMKWWSAFNSISQKHVDFVLMSAADQRPYLAIELDDSSHNLPERRNRDRFVDEVFRTAGLSLLHVRVQSTYDPEILRARIVQAIQPPPAK